MIRSAAFISLSDPQGPAHGGTLRTRGFITAFEKLGIETSTLFPTSPVGGTTSVSSRFGPLRSQLQELKRQYLPMPTLAGALEGDLRRSVRASHADLLVVSALSQAGYSELRDAPLWLDFMDVWSEFGSREARARSGLKRVSAELQAARLRSLEKRFAGRAAVVTAAGYADTELLRGFGIDATWLPTWLPPTDPVKQGRSVAPSRRCGFLGNFHYWPNRDAHELLVNEWLAPLSQRGWDVIVAGRGADELETHQGITNLGELEHVQQFYENVDLVLAPIRLGGGIKVKIIEAFAHQKPVVATPFALAGFPPQISSSVLTWDEGQTMPIELTGELDLPIPADEVLVPFSEENAILTISSLLEQNVGGPDA